MVILASDLVYLLINLVKLEHTSQFKLVKDPNSNRVKNLLIKKIIPVTLYDNLLIFRDSNTKFNLKGDLLKIITNYNFNTDRHQPQDWKLMIQYAKQMKFDETAIDNKINGDKSITRLLQSGQGYSKRKLSQNQRPKT